MTMLIYISETRKVYDLEVCSISLYYISLLNGLENGDGNGDGNDEKGFEP